MAKKTEVKDETQKKASIYLDADFILERNTQIIPTTPAVDSILCGGVPEGLVMLITGPEKLGKTSLALTIIRNAQRMGKVGIIVDAEHRLRKKILTGIEGLDISTEKLKIIRSTEGNILSAEQLLERAEQSLQDFPRSVLLIDSFSALCPAVEQAASYDDSVQMAARAKLEAKFFRKIAPIVSINGNIVIGIAHIASNIGSPGTNENIGKKAQYGLDIKVKCKKPFKAKDGVEFEWYSRDTQIGHRIIWECPTNAIGAGGESCVGYLRYGHGLDDIAEIIDAASELGIIKNSGPWYELPNNKKIQGWENMYDFLIQEENKEILAQIKKSYRELIQ